MGTENKYIKEIKYTEEQIQERIKFVANQINEEFKNSKEIIVVSILKGGLNFTFDLIKHLNVDLSIDFIKSKSYALSRKFTSPMIIFNPSVPLEGKDILLVDDFIDSGETLMKVRSYLAEHKPKSISAAAVVKKPSSSKNIHNMKVFACWNEEPGGFLMGYGLDYDEKYRNLPYIAIISYNNEDS